MAETTTETTHTADVAGPKQERARQTRRRILESAAATFARDGYEGSSLNDLIRESGVTKGAFYFHFASKHELALATFRYKQEQFVARTVAEASDQPDALAELGAIIRIRARLYREDPSARCILRLGAELGATAGPDSEFSRFQELTIETFAGVVRRGQSEGLVRPELDPRATAEVILATLIGADRLSRLLSGGSDLIERTEGLLAVLVHGLALGGPGDSHDPENRRQA